MIIETLTLKNFGLYGGEHTFALRPQPQQQFNRPIILFSGQNGAGKTTLLEAIRLCLHGALALGNRVKQADYEAHLIRRLHMPPNGNGPATQASIRLNFEYVTAGTPRQYEVLRQWRYENKQVHETLIIKENNHYLSEFKTLKEQEYFLRELVPPGVAQLFFFDGERLDLLTRDESSQRILAQTIRNLFGLNLVKQLRKDLDVFLTRQEAGAQVKALQQALNAEENQLEQIEAEIKIIEAELEGCERKLAKIEQSIKADEQNIAEQGDLFAQQRHQLRADKTRYEAELAEYRKQAQEMASGLLPFAIAPQMLSQVAQQLEREQEFEQNQAKQSVLHSLLDKLSDPGYWEDIPEPRQAKIQSAIKEEIPSATMDPADVMLHVSNLERNRLLNWIEQAQHNIPAQFSQRVEKIEHCESYLKDIEAKLALVPDPETLKPLAQRIEKQYEELAIQKYERQTIEDRLKQAHTRQTNSESNLRRIHDELAQQAQGNNRIRLATETHKLLGHYLETLTIQKMALLSKILTQRFNQLCRKADLVERIIVNPNTFQTTLMRYGREFAREQLSAGEKQLLAIATMWALREVSQVPLPVIMDTPLGRLDSEHRYKMLSEYFPQASHQVILLTTDAEIDEDMQALLEPAITRTYQLSEHHQASLEYLSPDKYAYQLPVLAEEGKNYETE